MGLYVNGAMVATNTPIVDTTQAGYDALSNPGSTNNTYFLSDSNDTTYQNLLRVVDLVGNEADLATTGNTTIAAAIADLYSRLDGLAFELDENTGVLSATSRAVNATTIPSGTYSTPTEKVNHLLSLLGSESTLANTGNTTVIGAILDLYERINTLKFAWNTGTSSLHVTVD